MQKPLPAQRRAIPKGRERSTRFRSRTERSRVAPRGITRKAGALRQSRAPRKEHSRWDDQASSIQPRFRSFSRQHAAPPPILPIHCAPIAHSLRIAHFAYQHSPTRHPSAEPKKTQLPPALTPHPLAPPRSGTPLALLMFVEFKFEMEKPSPGERRTIEPDGSPKELHQSSLQRSFTESR